MKYDNYLEKHFVSKLIYGLITVLAVLLVMEEHPPTPWVGAVTLFGTVFAVALAEAFSESIAEVIGRKRELDRAELHSIWRHVRPILLTANIPTLIVLLSSLGVYSMQTALLVSIGVTYLTLFLYGLRVGRVMQGSKFRVFLMGLFTAGIGGIIGLIKVLFH